MSRWKLPKGWAWVKAKDISKIVGGGTPPSKDPRNFDERGHPWITPADLSGYTGDTISRGQRSLSDEGLRRSSAQLLPPGTVLFTSRAPIGYCVVAENWLTTSQGFKNLIPEDSIDPQFIRHYLLASRDYAESLASGTTFKELSVTRMMEIEIPLPPLQEQQKISAIITASRAKSRRAIAALELVRSLTDELMQTVLAVAFRGDITEEWRRNNPHIEPASLLLRYIRTERRRQWEQYESSRRELPGEEPKDSKWRERYQEPVDIESRAPHLIPDTWEWTTLDTIALTKGGLAKGKRRRSQAKLRLVPYLRVANVQRGYLDLSELSHIAATESEIQDHLLAEGDILFNEGGDRDKLGRGWVWESQLPECIHQNHVFRARLVRGSTIPQLVSHYANSFGQEYFFNQGRQTTNLASISLNTLRSLPIPLMPIEEAERLDIQLSLIAKIVKNFRTQIEANIQQIYLLEKTIVDQAFRGLLTQHDSSEPTAANILRDIKKKRKKNPMKRKVEHKASPVAKKDKPSPKQLTIPPGHLRGVILAHGRSMDPRSLWEASDLSGNIDEFYAQLRKEISSGLLHEVRLSNKDRIIEVSNEN